MLIVDIGMNGVALDITEIVSNCSGVTCTFNTLLCSYQRFQNGLRVSSIRNCLSHPNNDNLSIKCYQDLVTIIFLNRKGLFYE